MMHTEFTSLMSAVLDHEAPPGDVRRLQDHLADCALCADTWARWRGLDALLRTAPMLAPRPSLVMGVAVRLEERRRRQRRRRWLGSGLILVWAGCLAAVLLVFLGLGLWGYAHPASLSGSISAGVGVLSGVLATARALRGTLHGLGVLPLSLGLTFYLGLTAAVGLIWFWLMAHKSVWAEALTVANDVSV